jgi:nicotinate-nucleotide adenylyltransferase
MKIFMGGTYDPVHIGHLRMALELSELFKTNVHLLPCFQPVHRGDPGATSAQRLEMLGLATEDEPTLMVDQREILRKGPSYTVDSLRSIRDQYGPDESVVLVLGTDAFNDLPDWHQWIEITKLAHIVVLTRPGWELSASGELGDLIKSCCFDRISGLDGDKGFESLFDRPAGYIVPLALSALDVSSSKIRNAILSGHSARYLVPDIVWRYICDKQLYACRENES